MKKIIYISLLVLLLFSCINEKNKKIDESSINKDNFIEKAETSHQNIYDSIIEVILIKDNLKLNNDTATIIWDKNSGLKREIKYLQTNFNLSDEDGIIEIKFFENEKLKSIELYNGKPFSSLWYKWHINGQLKEYGNQADESNFFFSILYDNGEKEETVKAWIEDILDQEDNLVGERYLESKIGWYKNGGNKFDFLTDHGNSYGIQREWYLNGQIKKETFNNEFDIENDFPEYYENCWDENGNKIDCN